MSDRLPVRPEAHNASGRLAASAAFLVFVVRPDGRDHLRVLLKGEHDGPFAAARQHAETVLLAAVAAHGAGLAVQLIDVRDGSLRFLGSVASAYEAGGAR